MQDDAVTSPELILVSPPEVAARARAALPDYAHEYEVQRVRAAYARATAVSVAPAPPRPRWRLQATALPDTRGMSRGSATFAMLVVLNCIAPFVLLIVARA